ncbi:cytochrome b561/ferric reductase transmembrane protein family [Striga asiatica]|uniref:Cytochrome b561/ferric reductase transmembrane protein family n=1 Tax=Striga asiatica TaxID=4170 RepID=A0A5A7NZW5_STRAF|nr:cytochrome b561/ferric reductase transmembrane protein family [Striga asiatica]
MYNSHKTFDIQLHGILLWASIGFLMPVGILAMRISSCSDGIHPSRRKILFYTHSISQVLSVLAVTIGAVLSIKKFENTFENSHQRIGLALYAAVYFQLVIGCRRPKRGTTSRRTWYFLHWLLGTTICLVGILNTYTGLQAYRKKTSKSATLWAVVFTAQVSFMVIFYLFQDKWEYILKQGMIASDNGDGELNNTSPVELENQIKEVLSEPRKSNALGTHFLRSNALNKLFQLT